MQINCQATPLADLGSYDQSHRGQHQHKDCDLVEQSRCGWEQMQRNYNSTI